MNIAQALRADSSIIIAFSGAGGKSTAMFELARQLPGPVLVTCSTHLGLHQARLADHHFVISEQEGCDSLKMVSGDGVYLFTGHPIDNLRLSGLNDGDLLRLHDFTHKYKYPLLIEADGSRGLPLKAPAEHEPNIPEWVDSVLVVAGLSGLGQPLTEEYVHRPKIFSQLSGMPIGHRITASDIDRVLRDPNGGLKNIPSAAKKCVLINQADNEEQAVQGYSIAQTLIPPYDVAMVGSLQNPETKSQISKAFEPISAIVLAAGGSSRLGETKVLLPWDNKPLVRHVVENALISGVSSAFVITGKDHTRIVEALSGLPVKCVFNPDWENGQSTSIRIGLDQLSSATGAAIFMLADQPQIPSRLISLLADTHHQTLAPIIYPVVDGRRGNPVLFDRVTFDDLRQLTGDTGGRVIISRYPATMIPWPDVEILMDIDTQDDYQAFLNRYSE